MDRSLPDLPPRTRENVAIIGFTQHGVNAPWKDKTWDFWGLNDLHAMFEAMRPGIFAEGCVEWFQLHHRGPTGEYPGARDETHTKWLTEQTVPIWMWAHDPTIPASRPYPIREILGSPILPHGKPISEEAYFNNTISWMLALAIARGYKKIGLFGVDMALDGVHGESEYAFQRPSVEYFIGVARGLGIDVVLPAESEVLKCGYLYGWDNSSWARRKFLDRVEGLAANEADSVNVYESVKRQVFELKGQLWGLEQAAALAAALPEEVKQVEAVKALIAEQATKLTEGRQKDVLANNELEQAKRRLHETRGALNDMKWVLRNYFPGDGPIQDVPRGPRSIVPSEPVVEQSDGGRPKRRGKNRVAALIGG